MVERGPIGLEYADYWNVALVLSIFELTLSLLFLLLAQTAASLVIRHANRRMPMLCTIRVLLCMLTTVWMGSLLLATPAVWRALQFAFKLPVEALSDVCWIQLVICRLAEPSLLTLIMLLLRQKATSASGLKHWSIFRITFIVGFVFTWIQGILCFIQRYGGLDETVFLRPEPELKENVSSNYLITSGPFNPDEHFPWWRNEGCADSGSSVVASALFLAPFLFYWTMACMRLRRLLMNQRLLRRLFGVQLTFTLVPTLMVLLRTLLLQVPSYWTMSRRLLRDGELLLALIGSTACVHALVSRPLLESRGTPSKPPNTKRWDGKSFNNRFLFKRTGRKASRAESNIADVSVHVNEDIGRQPQQPSPHGSQFLIKQASSFSAVSGLSGGDVDFHSNPSSLKDTGARTITLEVVSGTLSGSASESAKAWRF